MPTLHTTDDPRASRRGFLKRAGLGVGVLASATTLSACDSDREPVGGGVGDVRGRVTDGDGEPVAGAAVSLDSGASTTTDEDGRYEIADVAARSEPYTLTVSTDRFAEFGAATAQINILNGSVFTQDFVLGSVALDFNSDTGVLNYAYALEQLEAAFYATVLADDAFETTFNDDEQQILRDLAAHEAIHRDFLAAALGDAAIPSLEVDFSSVDFADRGSVLRTARTFEDLGVGAYNGAGQYLESGDLLTIAGKIVSVEARHASVVSGLLADNAVAGPGVIDANALDRALAPADVLAAAGPFIVNQISAVNA